VDFVSFPALPLSVAVGLVTVSGDLALVSSAREEELPPPPPLLPEDGAVYVQLSVVAGVPPVQPVGEAVSTVRVCVLFD